MFEVGHPATALLQSIGKFGRLGFEVMVPGQTPVRLGGEIEFVQRSQDQSLL